MAGLYIAKPGTNIRQAVEHAIMLARTGNTNIIVQMNEARFSVNPDTKVQNAIDTYLEVLDKIHKTKEQLKQKRR